MNPHCASRVAAAMLIGLLPVCAYSSEVESKASADTPAVSVDDMNLEAVGERIRQTGAQMQADLRKARARLEAHKAQQEAERKREAELARQQAIKDETEQAAIRERKEREAAQKQAEHARQAALVAQRAKDEQAAKAKAAKALKEARESSGAKAFE